ncbi:hypothetical protein JVT61DRAFT_8969 [Boletus reticuloceps]|uniref:Uncharacterized protein n=1 Tax=Boletus reticuloceps TaxID=495285 RepID=A0A8I2YHF5_9AGAM|nr:hypothetical protein JVT61DRAFT_8969 [Boletus reticuloceps]
MTRRAQCDDTAGRLRESSVDVENERTRATSAKRKSPLPSPIASLFIVCPFICLGDFRLITITNLTSLRLTIGAIVGGVVGGVSAVVLVATSREYKKNNGGRPQWNRLFYLVRWPRHFSQGATSSTVKPGVSRATPQPSIPPTSSTASSSPDPPSSGNNAALMEQVEMLKDGVARLRDLHDSDRHALTFQSETPPESS